ncbi:MAG TPA: efflux RND transporter periplasmic adaptor subunit [Kofleriaceae bacterium]|nr:efflux RND transporter periplasmic adaptor subunit [Kofleriaceae bacterium]
MRRIVTPLILIVLVILGVLLWRHFSGGETAAGGGPGGGGGGPPGGMQLPVEAMTVQPEPLAGGLSTVGTLRADESVVVRPEVPGRLIKIHFAEGQRVKAGAPLFSLDSSVPRANLREAVATLENARRTSARSVELASGSLISRSELENAQAQLSVNEARVASSRAQLGKMNLTAPFGGVVGLREVSVGAYVTAGQALVNLVRLDPMEVDFSLPERDLDRVAVGQPLAITVDAFPGQTFEGRVDAIDPMMDINTRSARLRAQIENPDYKLRPGLFARISLDTGGGAKALLVPEQALLQQGETRFLFRIVDGKASRTEVKTGRRVPGKLEITQGIKAGDQVIIAGQGKPMMTDGMPVVVVPGSDAKAAAPGGAPPGGPGAGQGAPGAAPAGDKGAAAPAGDKGAAAPAGDKGAAAPAGDKGAAAPTGAAPGGEGGAPAGAAKPADAPPSAGAEQPAGDTRKD